jgi:hypothetical protein
MSKLGYVYFIKSNDRVKIGKSKDVHERMIQLKTSNPYKLELIGVIEGYGEKENELHEKFKKYRLHGEWFSLSKEILDFVQTSTKVIFTKSNKITKIISKSNEKEVMKDIKILQDKHKIWVNEFLLDMSDRAYCPYTLDMFDARYHHVIYPDMLPWNS